MFYGISSATAAPMPMLNPAAIKREIFLFIKHLFLDRLFFCYKHSFSSAYRLVAVTYLVFLYLSVKTFQQFSSAPAGFARRRHRICLVIN
jgi:hypothetical protein